MKDSCIVFDLDDTLYKEIDFLKSAYKEIAENLKINSSVSYSTQQIYTELLDAYYRKDNPFIYALNKYKTSLTKEDLLSIYRNHFPDITLKSDIKNTITYLKLRGNEIGIITDGRSITQRNKIKALGLVDIINNDDILISEETGFSKPDERCYKYFMEKYPKSHNFIYIGDNPEKDFIAPNKLGWETVGIRDDGSNIHSQKISDSINQPVLWIDSIPELLNYIDK